MLKFDAYGKILNHVGNSCHMIPYAAVGNIPPISAECSVRLN